MTEQHTCQVCNQLFDPAGADAHTEFIYQHATLDRDGALDLGEDVWYDVWHLPCGTKYRLSRQLVWSESAFDYVPAFWAVEVDNHPLEVHMDVTDRDVDLASYEWLYELLHAMHQKALES